MLDAINRVSRILWEFTKFLALIVAVAILISTLFGNNVPFFGGILENTRIVVETSIEPESRIFLLRHNTNRL